MKRFTTKNPWAKEVFFEAVLESSPNLLVAINEAGEILYVNSAIESLFGYTSEELIGKPIELLVPERLRDIHAKHRKAYMTEPTPRNIGAGRELTGLRKNGTEFPIEIALIPKATDKGVFVLATLFDISERRNIERELRENEERLRVLVNSSPDSIFFKDGGGRWLEVNEAALDLFDLRNVDYRGKRDSELGELVPFHRTSLKYCEESDEAAWKTRHLVRGEETIQKSDGTTHVFDVIKVPLFHETGERKALLVVGRDITAHKRAQRTVEESEARFRTLVEGSPEIVFLTDMSSRMIYANQALQEQTGYTREDFNFPQNENRLIHPSDAENVARFIATFVASDKKHSERIENRFLSRSGEVLWFSSIVSKTIFDNLPALQFATYNITERKRVEEERDTLLHEAQQAIQRRDDFLSISAHELKTPLTALKMQIHLLHRVLSDEVFLKSPKMPALKRVLGNSEGQLDQFSHLVDDLLNASRIDAGRLTLDLEQFDLAALVRKVLERYRDKIAQSGCGIAFRAGSPVIGEWDPQRIEQVVVNLLENALKYGRRSPIQIELSEHDNFARFSIRDHGIGIAKEDQKRIFERFERAASPKSFRGFGLGLFISRSIVVAHAGTISVESELEHGATFIVELPVKAHQ